jgi:hypothetical protein
MRSLTIRLSGELIAVLVIRVTGKSTGSTKKEPVLAPKQYVYTSLMGQ